MKAISMLPIWFHIRRTAARMLRDRSGIAATEFAVIVPVMLVMFFGTVEFSSGVAVYRKVTLVTRTLSDLTSQSSTAMDDNYLKDIFTASIAMLTPYSPTPTNATLSEIYVDSNKVAKIQWSKPAIIASGVAQLTTSSRVAGETVTLPSQLLVKQTYLIFSEVSYLYTPTVGYVMGKTGVTLSDDAYTRPRQVSCVIYNNVPAANCPTP